VPGFDRQWAQAPAVRARWVAACGPWGEVDLLLPDEPPEELLQRPEGQRAGGRLPRLVHCGQEGCQLGAGDLPRSSGPPVSATHAASLSTAPRYRCCVLADLRSACRDREKSRRRACHWVVMVMKLRGR
jgi:hypothetical protein